MPIECYAQLQYSIMLKYTLMKEKFHRTTEVRPPKSTPKQETQVPSLGQEDFLEKKMATHSNNLAWGIPQTEKPGGLESMGSQKSWARLND